MRRLVRPGRSRWSLRAWQRQRADVRSWHVKARPGAKFGDRAGRDREMDAAGSRRIRLRAARDRRECSVTAPPKMTHAEFIDDLVAANRILADQGVLDAYGHIS